MCYYFSTVLIFQAKTSARINDLFLAVMPFFLPSFSVAIRMKEDKNLNGLVLMLMMTYVLKNVKHQVFKKKTCLMFSICQMSKTSRLWFESLICHVFL